MIEALPGDRALAGEQNQIPTVQKPRVRRELAARALPDRSVLGFLHRQPTRPGELKRRGSEVSGRVLAIGDPDEGLGWDGSEPDAQVAVEVVVGAEEAEAERSVFAQDSGVSSDENGAVGC